MFAVEETVTIARPVEEVFAFLADPTKIPIWRPDVLAVDGATGRLTAGATFDEWIRFGGRKAWRMRVVEVEPGRRAVIEAIAGPGVRPTQRFTCHPVDGGTRVTFRGTIHTLGAYRLVEPLLPRIIRRNWQRYLANLKAQLETAAGGGYARPFSIA